MSCDTFVPGPAEVHLDRLISADSSLILVLQAYRNYAHCLECQSLSQRIHSQHVRRLADLLWTTVKVTLQLHARRFFCDQPTCSKRTFVEPLPHTVAPRTRRTVRLYQTQQSIGLTAGGEPGSRLAHRLAMPVSGDTLLRFIRQATRPLATPVCVVGVDDWAWRKGQRYGTILVDLEQHRVLDLLPDRETETVAAWMRQQPGLTVVSRDRSGAYADAVRQAVPEAVQVADRWHLLKNCTEAIQQALERKHSQLRQAAQAVNESLSVIRKPTVRPELPMLGTRLEQQRKVRADQRQTRYEEVVCLHQQGISHQAIARTLYLGRNTVRRWLRAGHAPSHHRSKRHSKLDRYISYLQKRWSEGCHNAACLFREMQQQGYRESDGLVRRWVARHCKADLPAEFQHAAKRSTAIVERWQAPSVRQTAWLLLDEAVQLDAKKQAYLDCLLQISPEIRLAQELARQFMQMVKQRRKGEFAEWLKRAQNSELRSFAAGIRRDQRAVEAAVSLKWSNGQTEGQVQRLKLLKRQMYGRAKLDLLKQRVLGAA